MRLGISSPLKHDNPEMPMILEHLNTDEEYIRYLGYIKKEIV